MFFTNLNVSSPPSTVFMPAHALINRGTASPRASVRLILRNGSLTKIIPLIVKPIAVNMICEFPAGNQAVHLNQAVLVAHINVSLGVGTSYSALAHFFVNMPSVRGYQLVILIINQGDAPHSVSAAESHAPQNGGFPSASLAFLYRTTIASSLVSIGGDP